MHTSVALAALPAPARQIVEDFRSEFGEVLLLRCSREEAAPGRAVPAAEPARDGAVPVPGSDLLVMLPAQTPAEARPALAFLARALARALRHDDEIRSFSREVAERYEEITLLYSISEILGSILSLPEAAETILEEVRGTLGARRASLWVRDGDAPVLQLASVAGGAGSGAPVSIGDPCSITAEVFRAGRPVLLGPSEAWHRPGCEETGAPRGAFLSVPVVYTPPDGETRSVGVINLTGRDVEGGFSAGDVKLLSAIASQIGAAVENRRLIDESLRQERVMREMELAHDLQLKLLPPLEQFAGYADVAARCAPAESVGGDFYQLFRLSGGRLGVMIGDVSSHGFGAALIMALTMSAVAIHASEGDPPAEVLRRTHHALIDELETTEMYLTLFYGVIDPARGEIRYANAGHAHAFHIDAEGGAHRLGATDPPFGITDTAGFGERVTPWQPGRDLLFLFTDGLSDSLGKGETAGAHTLVETVRAARDERPAELIERVFELPHQRHGHPADDRTAVIVRL